MFIKFLLFKDFDTVYITVSVDREKFFLVAESLSNNDFSEIYIDFGAPESEQFPSLFTIDFSPEEFLEFQNGIEATFIFNCVVGGGAMYRSCFDYLSDLNGKIGHLFKVQVFANMHYFFAEIEQLDHLRQYCKTQGLHLVEFGQFNTQQSSGQAIIENIKRGRGLDTITSFATKTILKRSLAAI